MKDHCVMGIICKVWAVLAFLVQMISCVVVVAAGWVSPGALPGQFVGALIWPMFLWSFGEVLDRQKVQGKKLDRILELLGDVEEPEEDLTQLEARLEGALETGEEPEWPQEKE